MPKHSKDDPNRMARNYDNPRNIVYVPYVGENIPTPLTSFAHSQLNILKESNKKVIVEASISQRKICFCTNLADKNNKILLIQCSVCKFNFHSDCVGYSRYDYSNGKVPYQCMKCFKQKHNNDNLAIPVSNFQQEVSADRLYTICTIGNNVGKVFQSMGYRGLGPNGLSSADAKHFGASSKIPWY